MNCRYFGELEIVHQCPASLLGQSTQDKLKHEVALLQVFGLLPLFRFSTSMESGVVKVQLDAVTWCVGNEAESCVLYSL